MIRQSTQPVIYVSGTIDDNNVHKDESRTWYSSVFNAVCGSIRKECCAKNRMQVTESTPTALQLVKLIRVRISRQSLFLESSDTCIHDSSGFQM